MKKSNLIWLLLLSQMLNATDMITNLAKKLAPILCKEESIVECNTLSYISTNGYLKLDNNKILLFFKIYNPNSPLYHYGTQNAIVVFDKNGNEKIINTTISGSISSIKRDQNGGIWISHPWNIEGTSPALSFSSNGTKWQSIKLPIKRPNLSIEWMNMCLFDNGIALKFSNDEIFNYWKTSYKDAIKPFPNWKQINKNEYNSKRCLNANAINNNWEKINANNKLKFKNSINSIQLIIPKKIPLKNITNSLYSIQVGHFNRKESMDIVSKQLNEVIAYPLISKTFSNNTYKLFLGTFKTPQEAKDALNRLKRRYKKNIYINEAFITKLPR